MWNPWNSYHGEWEPIDWYTTQDRAETHMRRHNEEEIHLAEVRAKQKAHVVTETLYGPEPTVDKTD